MTIAGPTNSFANPAGNDVVLDEFGHLPWRVLNASAPSDDAAALLGFVCVAAGVYEVTFLARPLEISFCDDLDSVRAVFADAM